MKGTKTQNGITLIALIITIVVLLILAGVAISTIQESDIIGKAKEAVEKHEAGKADEESKLQGYEDFLESHMPGEGGDDIVTPPVEDDKEDSLLEKYILGQDLEGRPVTDIIDTATFSFIDDTTTEGRDETITIGAEFIGGAEEDNLEILYFKNLKGVTYKFGVINSYITDKDYGVVKVYEPEEGTRVGKTVKYDNKIWTILYDDNTNGLQMISNQSFLYNNSEFCLGENDSLITDWSKITGADFDGFEGLGEFEKTVYSYNHAIDTLNIACEDLLKDDEGKYKSENIIDVRCVGSNPTNKNAENKILYTSENLAKWPINNESYLVGMGNERGKSADLNYVSDYDIMIALGINIGYDAEGVSDCYWLASRLVLVDSDEIGFGLRRVHQTGELLYGSFWWVEESDIGCNDDSSSLRPVVTLKSDINLVEDTTGEADYTF